MTLQSTKRFVTFLDIGAASSFIDTEKLPHRLQGKVSPLNENVNVWNAIGEPDPVRGTTKLVVKIGTSTETVRFYVVDNLTTAVFLRYNFCDRYVDGVRPRLKIVCMDVGATVPNVRQPSKSNTTLPIPDEQQFKKQNNRSSPKIEVTVCTRLHPGMETLVEVTTEQEEIVLIVP